MSEQRPAEAVVREDFQAFGIKAAIRRRDGSVYVWPEPYTVREFDGTEELRSDDWLKLDHESARALYEALAEHFGHAGHDIRALRKDYEAERRRVDKFIDKAVKS